MTDFSGSTLGKYKVDERIAVGGMAEIYRAHLKTGDPVAIKVIHPRLAAEMKFIQMFLDEAKIAVSLRHPNIVQIFDFGRVGDTYYLSMEWIDGKPLATILERQLELGMPLPVEVALVAAIDVLKGLQYVHMRRDRFDRPLGIVHRDVSPPNVLVTRTGLAKVADFGIAHAENKVVETRPGIIRGKFSYMSPEQSRGEEVDGRSDLFSVGIVLHEMLSGKRLFFRAEEMETIEAVRKCDVPPLRPGRPEVSENLERIVRRALSRDRDRRHPSAVEFAAELWLEGKKIDPDLSHRTMAQYLKTLYPWETFVGADEPLKTLVARFTERRSRAVVERSIAAFPGARPALDPWRLTAHLLVGLGALFLAEILSR